MENLSDLFVPYKIALRLKIKGFNEPCLAIYNNSSIPFIAGNTPVFNDKTEDESIITAPVYEQVVDWFLEKHNILIESRPLNTFTWWDGLVYIYNEDIQRDFRDSGLKTRKEALIIAIEEALKLI